MTATSHPARSAAVGPVIALTDVERLQAAGRDVVIADVRWYLDGRDGRAAYEAAHLPGALFVDLHSDLSRHDLAPTEGRHPFPTAESFAAALGRLGIGDETVVVAYDDSGGITAGRLVVMLRMIGAPAALLDGGIAAWPGELATGPSPVRPAVTREVVPWPAERFASADEASRTGDDPGATIDARPFERFTGAVAMIDPRAGHVPGATNAPWDAVLDPTSRRFLDPSVLAVHFARLGITPTTEVIAYCGSGVSACMNLLAMEHAGLPVPRLYVASFSGWSADPERSVETGDGRTPTVQE